MAKFIVILTPAIAGSTGASYLYGSIAAGFAVMIAWTLIMTLLLHTLHPRNRP